jgi:hypothetical protein
MKKFVLAGLFVVGLFVGNVNISNAAFVDNAYGVPEQSAQENDYEMITCKLFEAFSISSSWGTITGHGTDSFIFEGGGTSNTAGKVNVAGYDDLLLYYNMGTYTSTGTYTIRLYIQSGVENTWFDLGADIVMTGTTTGAINISETGAKSFRAGLNTTAIGTESVTVTLDKRRKKR